MRDALDEKAVLEIRGLSIDARRYLQHRLRNGLQSMLSSIESGSIEGSVEAVEEMAEELRRLGL